jgi:hypothetical protein
MPVSPLAVAAMLACARIGAVHTVVFAGFSAESLAGRINDGEHRRSRRGGPWESPGSCSWRSGHQDGDIRVELDTNKKSYRQVTDTTRDMHMDQNEHLFHELKSECVAFDQMRKIAPSRENSRGTG